MQSKHTFVWFLIKPGPKPCLVPKGMPFQTRSLQIILFGPFTYEPKVIPGPLKIVAPQEPITIGQSLAMKLVVA